MRRGLETGSHEYRASPRPYGDAPPAAASLQVVAPWAHRLPLVTGWAAAIAYPARGLRRYGDIDFRVPRKDFAAALVAQREAIASGCPVDVRADRSSSPSAHAGLPRSDKRC